MSMRQKSLLERKAHLTAADILGDHPEADVGFETYMYYHETDLEQVSPIGYIYMGDMGEWAFRWDSENEQWEDAYDMLSWVKSKSPYKGW